jgi:type II secretory pathway pseudopilin PulG
MRPLDLDYIPQRAWASRSGLVILLVALLVAAGMPALYAHYADQREALQARQRQLQRSEQYSAGRGAPSGAALQEVQAEIRRANEVIVQLDLPWGPLFEAVEGASHEQVALLGIQPDAQNRTLSLAAEAKDMSGAVAYVKRLGNEAIFSDTHIVNHQVQEQDPDKPLRFSVQAVWREKAQGVGK